MGIFRGPQLVREGLVLALDAAEFRSYSGTGIIWNDLSIIGGYGTMYNSPGYNVDKYFEFDGVNDYNRFIRTDVNGGSWAHGEATIIAWIKPSSTGSITVTANNVFTSESAIEISIGNRENGYSGVQYASNPWAWRGTNKDSLVNDVWNMLSYVHSTVDRKVYVNDVLQYIVTDTGTLNAGTASYPWLTLMGRQSGTGSPCKGGLAAVYLYNRPFTQEEITATFNALRERFGL